GEGSRQASWGEGTQRERNEAAAGGSPSGDLNGRRGTRPSTAARRPGAGAVSDSGSGVEATKRGGGGQGRERTTSFSNRVFPAPAGHGLTTMPCSRQRVGASRAILYQKKRHKRAD